MMAQRMVTRFMSRAFMSRAALRRRFSKRARTLIRHDRARDDLMRRRGVPIRTIHPSSTRGGWHLAKGYTLVDANILRHAQHPLGDNVRHDFVGAARNPQARRGHIGCLE